MLKDCPPFIVHRRDDHILRHLLGTDPRLERHRAATSVASKEIALLNGTTPNVDAANAKIAADGASSPT